MRTSARRVAPVVITIGLLGGAIGLAASCSGGGSSATRPEPDGGRDAFAETAPETGGGGAGGAAADADAAPACDPDPHTPLVPNGWIRFPGLPCQCTIWLAPSQDLMTPAPKWVKQPEGWLELDDPQAGDPYTIGVPHGESYAGTQMIAYQRVLAGVLENVVLDVKAERYIFDDRDIVKKRPYEACDDAMDALGQHSVLHQLWVNSYNAPSLEEVAVSTAGAPVPAVLRKQVDDGYQGWAVGAHVAAVAPSWNRFDAFTLDPVHAHPDAWVSAGRMLDRFSMFGWDSTLFFGALALDSGATEQYLAWDRAHGARPLVGTGPGESPTTSICGLGTDGKTLVWTQLDAWDGQTWQQARVMRAPLTTDATSLKPSVIRSSPSTTGCSGYWVVGGGYAAQLRALDKTSKTKATFIVRLSDGAEWKLDTPGVYFQPLYLTDTEMGALKDYDKPIPGGPDGFTGYRIARYPLSLLGAPNVP